MHDPQQLRLAIRNGEWTSPTINAMPGYVLCNLVVVPRAYALDFCIYCQRNPKPCPVIEILDPGDPEPKYAAPGADVRTDLPRYNVYRDGTLAEQVTDIRQYWHDECMAFLIGSGITFDAASARAGAPRPANVPVVTTAMQTAPAGPFRGPVAATMRVFTPAQAIIATQLTARFYFNHGAPIHIGDPALIGADLAHPLAGQPITQIPDGLLPVFWACGVTPQLAAEAARLPLMITHTPGHGFVTDLLADRLCLP